MSNSNEQSHLGTKLNFVIIFFSNTWDYQILFIMHTEEPNDAAPWGIVFCSKYKKTFSRMSDL
jgi:hypothetical protein